MNDIIYLSIKQKDGYITNLSYIQCPKKPKASILILHGMAEHQNRYYNFIEFLITQGFDVFIYDHRGHGKDKKLNELGYFAPNNGDQIVIEDVLTITEYIEKNSRSNKLFLFGHSMGSIIARNVLQTYDKYTGVILSGTAFPPKYLNRMGIIVASIIKKIKGENHLSTFLNKLLFGNKKFLQLADRTAFDWLTRSHPIVGAYIHDPFCGFLCTSSFYLDLLRLTSHASQKRLIRKTRLDLPIYIISGDRDPVGTYGVDTKRLIDLYEDIGFSQVTSKLYPDCRHELLNELNNEEVYNDIGQWLLKNF